MVQTPPGVSIRESCAMGESLTQRRRVREEGLRIVNLCKQGRMPGYAGSDGTCKVSSG